MEKHIVRSGWRPTSRKPTTLQLFTLIPFAVQVGVQGVFEKTAEARPRVTECLEKPAPCEVRVQIPRIALDLAGESLMDQGYGRKKITDRVDVVIPESLEIVFLLNIEEDPVGSGMSIFSDQHFFYYDERKQRYVASEEDADPKEKFPHQISISEWQKKFPDGKMRVILCPREPGLLQRFRFQTWMPMPKEDPEPVGPPAPDVNKETMATAG